MILKTCGTTQTSGTDQVGLNPVIPDLDFCVDVRFGKREVNISPSYRTDVRTSICCLFISGCFLLIGQVRAEIWTSTTVFGSRDQVEAFSIFVCGHNFWAKVETNVVSFHLRSTARNGAQTQVAGRSRRYPAYYSQGQARNKGLCVGKVGQRCLGDWLSSR